MERFFNINLEDVAQKCNYAAVGKPAIVIGSNPSEEICRRAIDSTNAPRKLNYDGYALFRKKTAELGPVDSGWHIFAEDDKDLDDIKGLEFYVVQPLLKSDKKSE